METRRLVCRSVSLAQGADTAKTTIWTLILSLVVTTTFAATDEMSVSS